MFFHFRNCNTFLLRRGVVIDFDLLPFVLQPFPYVTRVTVRIYVNFKIFRVFFVFQIGIGIGQTERRTDRRTEDVQIAMLNAPPQKGFA